MFVKIISKASNAKVKIRFFLFRVSSGDDFLAFTLLPSTQKTTRNVHPFYEQCTSNLRAMYIQSTSNVHPYYEQSTSKLRGRSTSIFPFKTNRPIIFKRQIYENMFLSYFFNFQDRFLPKVKVHCICVTPFLLL